MNKLLKALFHFYMMSATEADGGGAEVVDRGDDIPEETVESVAEEVVEETLVEEVAEEEVEAPRDEKGRFIPKERFDEAVGKERDARTAAEQRLATLEAELKSRQVVQTQGVEIDKIEAHISALEEQHATFLLDGDGKKAAELMREIRHAERQIAKIEMQQDSGRITAHAIEAERVEYAIATLEAEHPEFNPDSEEFDEDLVELVLAKQQRLIQTENLAPSKALVKASQDVLKKLGAKPAQDDAKGLAAAKAGQDRKSAQIAKNLETQKRQPASMRDSGMDSDKAGQGVEGIDPTKLSYDEFVALPDSTKAKLRGDKL